MLAPKCRRNGPQFRIQHTEGEPNKHRYDSAVDDRQCELRTELQRVRCCGALITARLLLSLRVCGTARLSAYLRVIHIDQGSPAREHSTSKSCDHAYLGVVVCEFTRHPGWCRRCVRRQSQQSVPGEVREYHPGRSRNLLPTKPHCQEILTFVMHHKDFWKRLGLLLVPRESGWRFGPRSQSWITRLSVRPKTTHSQEM